MPIKLEIYETLLVFYVTFGPAIAFYPTMETFPLFKTRLETFDRCSDHPELSYLLDSMGLGESFLIWNLDSLEL